MAPYITFVVIISFMAPQAHGFINTGCNLSSVYESIRGKLHNPCHNGSAGPRLFNFTHFSSTRDRQQMGLEKLQNATQAGHKLFQENLGHANIAPGATPYIFQRCSSRSLTNAANKLRSVFILDVDTCNNLPFLFRIQENRKNVHAGLRTIQKSFRCYYAGAEVLLGEKTCLHAMGVIYMQAWKESNDRIYEMKNWLLNTLCSYQMYGVDTDEEGIRGLLSVGRPQNLSEVDIDGLRLTKNMLDNLDRVLRPGPNTNRGRRNRRRIAGKGRRKRRSSKRNRCKKRRKNSKRCSRRKNKRRKNRRKSRRRVDVVLKGKSRGRSQRGRKISNKT